MGLTIEDGEELYLIRMSIQLDQKVFAMSFNKSDRRRLEQLVIDALGRNKFIPQVLPAF